MDAEALITLALSTHTLLAREHIDASPIEVVEDFLARAPKTRVPPALLALARQRRAWLRPETVFVPHALPADKAAFLAALADTLSAIHAAGRDPQGRVLIPFTAARVARAVEALRALEVRACDAVVEGALFLGETRIRPAGQPEARPLQRACYLVADAAEPGLRGPLDVGGLPTHVLHSTGRTLQALGGAGVGAVWEIELLSVRAQHLKMGLHAPVRDFGPEEVGASQLVVLDIA